MPRLVGNPDWIWDWTSKKGAKKFVVYVRAFLIKSTLEWATNIQPASSAARWVRAIDRYARTGKRGVHFQQYWMFYGHAAQQQGRKC